MEYRFGISLLKDRRRWRQDLFFPKAISVVISGESATSLCWMKSWRKAFGEKASVWAEVRGDQNKHIRYIEVHSLSGVWKGWKMRFYEYSIILASKKKPVLHKQYGCGGTSVRRHGKEDAQVTERRRGLHCCYYEMWDWLPLYLRNDLHDQEIERAKKCRWSEAQQGVKTWLLPTKEKPLSYVGWRKTKALWKGGLGWIPFQWNIPYK